MASKMQLEIFLFLCDISVLFRTTKKTASKSLLWQVHFQIYSNLRSKFWKLSMFLLISIP